MAIDRPDGNARRYPLQELMVGLVFFACACAAIALTRVHDGVAVVWPANGIAAAMLIRLRDVRWVRAGIALLGAGLLANVVAANDAPRFALALTTVNLAEIAAMVALYRFAIPLPYPNLSIGQATRMTLVMGVGVTGVASLAGGFIVHDAFGGSLTRAIERFG
ncbi:hypothetical protein EON77_07240 [bacterium]|nr:MAG: hypothetical protein EON77_07240 [bacterium]